MRLDIEVSTDDEDEDSPEEFDKKICCIRFGKYRSD